MGMEGNKKSLRISDRRGVSFTEVVLGLALAMFGIMAVMQFNQMRFKAIKNNRESGELRDIREYLNRNLSCSKTINDPGCGATNSIVTGKRCDGSDLISNNGSFILADRHLRVSCGTGIGTNRMLVEYTPVLKGQSNYLSSATWNDINRNIPWVCDSTVSAKSFSDFKIGDNYMCGISSGEVYCWGNNQMGVLGLGDTSPVLPPNYGNITGAQTYRNSCPVKINNLVGNVSELRTGPFSACAKDTTGWKCWGAILSDATFGNLPILKWHFFDTSGVDSSLGNNTQNLAQISLNPVPAITDANISEFSLDGRDPCTIYSGSVRCFRNTHNYALNNFQRLAFANIGGTSGATKVSGDSKSGCAVQNGGVVCWVSSDGYINPYPSFGSYSTYGVTPINASVITNLNPGGGHNVTDLFGDITSGCARKASGEIWCWGKDEYGQLGNGDGATLDKVTMAVKVNLPSNNTSFLQANNYFLKCAIVDQAVWCWGKHPIETLYSGVGTFSVSYTDLAMENPFQVPGFGSGIQKLSCSSTSTGLSLSSSAQSCCALDSSGKIRCFGENRGMMFKKDTGLLYRFSNEELKFEGCSEFDTSGTPSTPNTCN